MICLSFAFLVLCLSFWSYADGSRYHIVHGTTAEKNSHPWLLDMGFCGAALLKVRNNSERSDIVIGAAHCIFSCKDGSNLSADFSLNDTDRRRLYSVQAKKHNETDDTEDIEIRTIIGYECHPDFDANKTFAQYDVAVLKLESPLEFESNAIVGVDLVESNETLEPGRKCVVAGWGGMNQFDRKKHDPQLSATVLQELDLEILADEACNGTIYRGEAFVPELMICAQASNRLGTPCGGDSGGPLICPDPSSGRPVLHGVVSFGTDGCVKGKPAVYTELRVVSDWILDTADRLTSL